MSQLLDKERDRRARLLEVFVSVAASALTSAVIVSWTLSATLSRFETQIAEHERRLVVQQAQMQTLGDRSVLAAEKIARVDAQYEDILRRLDSIDRKLGR